MLIGSGTCQKKAFYPHEIDLIKELQIDFAFDVDNVTS